MSYFAITGFIVSFVIHFSTVAGVNTFATFDFIFFILTFAMFIPSTAMILSARKNFSGLKKGEFNTLLFSSTPKHISILAKLTLTYAVLNFFYTISYLHDGYPAIEYGVYIIENHGHHVRDITFSEYLSYKRIELRMASGHWMAFYVFPAIYYKYLKCRT